MPTPFVSKRAPIYADVPDEKWNDWRWQLSHRLNSTEEIEKVLPLNESERKALNTSGLFRVDITPYFISLIDPDDPDDPIRKQVIPLSEEMQSFTAMMEDSLAEDRHSPVPGLVHRYPDRVLMLVTTQCASYCRYCTRSRIVGDPGQTFSARNLSCRSSISSAPRRSVTCCSPAATRSCWRPKSWRRSSVVYAKSRTLRIVRIGSRVPVFMPMRITQELCDTLAKYHPLWLNIHVNHSNENFAGTRTSLRPSYKSRDSAWEPVCAAGGRERQCPYPAQARAGPGPHPCPPYYLYQCDLVEGAGHFRTPVAKGIEIMEGPARTHVRLCRPAIHRGCPRRRREDPRHAQLPAEHV